MSRPGILTSYRDEMITYLRKVYGFSEEEADRRFRLACKDRYCPMTALIAENIQDGLPVLRAVDLVTYLDKNADNLISPSGSFYCQHDKKTGATIAMVQNKLKQRKIVKKQMLAAKAVEDMVTYLTCYFLQTLIKIGVNALPGNYGFSTSLFYDKGNYNAITSAGRALIGFANTCIEHVLGGNFGWFTMDQLINHITIHLGTFDKQTVMDVMKRHNLRMVSKFDLIEFYKKELLIYHKYSDFSRIERLVDKLNETEVQFFWYYQNLRHVIMENDDVFRPWMEEMFNLDNIDMNQDVNPDDLFKLDGALVTMVNVAFDKTVNSGDPEIQVYDLPKKMPDLAKKFVCIAKHVESRLTMMTDIFEIFIFTAKCVPDVENRKMMLRNSSVISDTDSVIFTVKDWVQWYTHDIYKICPETYHIACLMIYWITQAVAHSLKLFSIAHGAKGDRVKDMAMKNEFLYPTMCLADIKKTYAGIVTVQEGVILSRPSPDIKGVQLKGSDICKEATDAAEKFIVNDILMASLNAKLDGHKLISKVMDFEQKIYDETIDGSTKWCQPLAIKEKDSYAKPLSSQYFYYMAWMDVFAWKYGEIQLPTKATVIPIAHPTPQYFDWLRKESPKCAKLFESFLAKYPKALSKIALSPVTNKIPKELIPLLMVRDIVFDNVKPFRLILKQLGISCGFDEDKLLFSEVYGNHKILSRTVNNTQTKE